MSYDLELLDFANIRRILQQYTKTPYGRELVEDLKPAPSLVIAQRMQDSISCARILIDSGNEYTPEETPNCRASLKQTENPGATLNSQALANLVKLITCAIYTNTLIDSYPELKPVSNTDIQIPLTLKSEIEKAITDAGRLKPDASQTLQDLNTSLTETRAIAEEKIQALIKREKISEYLLKGNHYHWNGHELVLLVENQHIDKIKGAVKGSYPGGKAQMIGPLQLFSENNQIEKTSQAIYAEQQRILRSLTQLVSQNREALKNNIDVITWVDVAFSAAQLSAIMNASAPEFCDNAKISLNQVYHPMLLIQFVQGKISQPTSLSIEISEGKPFVLITGPNTGGKTVVLKTVGLLQLMAQCGLHIPSEGKCEIGWFDTIMVDMGDRQSMYHQLSTFAGHVEVMKNILSCSGKRSLFLLDELGTGTDPEEGASLAMAIIDELIENGSLGIVNTHLPQLKPYSVQNEKIQHAAMMFDKNTLTPNYQLQFGETGQSLGLIIAEKNGLPENIVAKAKSYHNDLRKADLDRNIK